jgi:hypothetical protein
MRHPLNITLSIAYYNIELFYDDNFTPSCQMRHIGWTVANYLIFCLEMPPYSNITLYVDTSEFPTGLNH